MEEVYFSQVNLVFLTFQNLTSSTVLSVLAVLLKELLVGNRKKKKGLDCWFVNKKKLN